MVLHLLGTNPLHLNLVQGTLITAGWLASDVQVQPNRLALEQALQGGAPATVVVDMGPAQDSETLQWLQQLTRQWPMVQVILLCSQRSESLLLEAMRSGVREVLDSPPEPQALLQAVQRLTATLPSDPSPQKKGQAPASAVLGFVGSKGGCGNTLLAANLCWLLASEFQRDCVLLDLDLLYGDASFYLGGGHARHNIVELLRQGERLDGQLLRSSLHTVHERFALLAAPAYPSMTLPPLHALPRVLELLRQQYPVVVVDVPHHMDALGWQALGMADQVFVTMQKHVPDVRNAQRLMRLLREQGVRPDRLRPVLNRHNQAGGLDEGSIDKAIEPALAHRIADDATAMQACVHLGVPLHGQSPGSPVLRDLRQMASTALHLPLPRRGGWLSRWIGPPQ